jgi:hypothetical protein
MSLKKITTDQKTRMDEEFKQGTDSRFATMKVDKKLFEGKAMKLALLESVCRTHYQDVCVLGGKDNAWKLMNILH